MSGPGSCNELILDHIDWAHKLAYKAWVSMGRQKRVFCSYEDALSEVLLALVEVAYKYDPDSGAPFHSFARRRLLGAPRDFRRRMKWGPRYSHDPLIYIDEYLAEDGECTIEDKLSSDPARVVYDRIRYQGMWAEIVQLPGVRGSLVVLREQGTKRVDEVFGFTYARGYQLLNSTRKRLKHFED